VGSQSRLERFLWKLIATLSQAKFEPLLSARNIGGAWRGQLYPSHDHLFLPFTFGGFSTFTTTQ
jgi:hypothetical protein